MRLLSSSSTWTCLLRIFTTSFEATTKCRALGSTSTERWYFYVKKCRMKYCGWSNRGTRNFVSKWHCTDQSCGSDECLHVAVTLLSTVVSARRQCGTVGCTSRGATVERWAFANFSSRAERWLRRASSDRKRRKSTLNWRQTNKSFLLTSKWVFVVDQWLIPCHHVILSCAGSVERHSGNEWYWRFNGFLQVWGWIHGRRTVCGEYYESSTTRMLFNVVVFLVGWWRRSRSSVACRFRTRTFTWQRRSMNSSRKSSWLGVASPERRSSRTKRWNARSTTWRSDSPTNSSSTTSSSTPVTATLLTRSTRAIIRCEDNTTLQDMLHARY